MKVHAPVPDLPGMRYYLYGVGAPHPSFSPNRHVAFLDRVWPHIQKALHAQSVGDIEAIDEALLAVRAHVQEHSLG